MRGTPPAVRLACGSLMVRASDVDAAGLHLYDAGGLHTRSLGEREFIWKGLINTPILARVRVELPPKCGVAKAASVPLSVCVVYGRAMAGLGSACAPVSPGLG